MDPICTGFKKRDKSGLHENQKVKQSFGLRKRIKQKETQVRFAGIAKTKTALASTRGKHAHIISGGTCVKNVHLDSGYMYA